MRQEQPDNQKKILRTTLLAGICLVLAAACLTAVFARDSGAGGKGDGRAPASLYAAAQGNGTGENRKKDLSADDTEITAVISAEPDSSLMQDILFLQEHGIPVPEKSIDFAQLKENTNSDIYAWVYVPDTLIDYPVLQHPTDNSRYLNYNLDGSKGYPGCIYTENYNAKDFGDFNTVLYGHNMKNGTMFANLHKFEDTEFFAEHPYVYIYTEERLLVYEVFDAYRFSNVHLLLGYDLETEKGIREYLEEVKAVQDKGRNSREELFPDWQARILTLSTCIKDVPEGRYLVQGVLLNGESK